MAEGLGDERLLGGEALLARIHYYHHTLQSSKDAATCQRALDLVRRSGRPWDLSSVLGYAIMAWCCVGEFDRARAAAVEALPLGRKEGDLGTVGHAIAGTAFADLAAGQLGAARGGFEELAGLWEAAGFPWVTLVWAFVGTTARLQGDWTAARQLLDKAVASALSGSFEGCEETHLLLFESYAGDPGAAARLDRLSERLPRAGGTYGVGAWMVLLASVESAAVLGRREQAAVLYPLVRQLMGNTVTPWGVGLVEKVAGIAAAASRAWADAETHFTSAQRMADAIPHKVEQADVRRWHARMLLDRNEPADRDQARRLLSEARVGYQQIGMPRHVEMVDELLKEA